MILLFFAKAHLPFFELNCDKVVFYYFDIYFYFYLFQNLKMLVEQTKVKNNMRNGNENIDRRLKYLWIVED